MNVDKHTFICGITDSGKTYYMSWIYKNVKGFAVFVNTNAEKYPEEVSQFVVHDIDGFLEAFNEHRATKICFTPPNGDITNEDIITLKDILFALGKDIVKDRRKAKMWCHIFIDEIQEYSSKTKKDPEIDALFKRGYRHGIVAYASSQRPADVSHTILTQCKYHTIFKLGTYEEPYFNRYHIPHEEFKDYIENPYHFVIWDGYSYDEFPPIEIEE